MIRLGSLQSAEVSQRPGQVTGFRSDRNVAVTCDGELQHRCRQKRVFNVALKIAKASCTLLGAVPQHRCRHRMAQSRRTSSHLPLQGRNKSTIFDINRMVTCGGKLQHRCRREEGVVTCGGELQHRCRFDQTKSPQLNFCSIVVGPGMLLSPGL